MAVDDQGDVTAEFAGAGVGLFPATGTPRLLIPANAGQLAMSSADVVFALCAGYGVYHYDAVHGWTRLTTNDALLIAAS